MIPRPLVRVNQWTIVIAVLLTWITRWDAWLWIPLFAGVTGLATGVNPLMRFARLFLRQPMSHYAMEDRSQQQFNQWIAVSCLAASLIASYLHWTAAADVFSAMVGLAAMVAILGFCIGCFLRFQWNQYRYRRTRRM
jgi:hypothetical protein